ncbi:MAG: hypothetical protein ACXWVD_12600, partial [Telluria sp.]
MTLGGGLVATAALYAATSSMDGGATVIALGGAALTLAAAAGAQSLAQRARRLQQVLDQRGAELAHARQCIATDAIERSANEQRIHHIAQHDVLTGLPGRSLLQDRMGLAIAASEQSGHQLWVMLI